MVKAKFQVWAVCFQRWHHPLHSLASSQCPCGFPEAQLWKYLSYQLSVHLCHPINEVQLHILVIFCIGLQSTFPSYNWLHDALCKVPIAPALETYLNLPSPFQHFSIMHFPLLGISALLSLLRNSEWSSKVAEALPLTVLLDYPGRSLPSFVDYHSTFPTLSWAHRA